MQTIGKVQLEHYDNAMSCLTMVIKGVSKKARQDTRRDKYRHRQDSTTDSVGGKCCHEKGISFGTYDSR